MSRTETKGVKMKDFLGITSDSIHYYANQTPQLKAGTRLKIKQSFDVLMKAGKDRDLTIDSLSGRWLCDKSVVLESVSIQTAEEIQDLYAESKGFSNFIDLFLCDKNAISWHVDNVQQIYARQEVGKALNVGNYK